MIPRPSFSDSLPDVARIYREMRRSRGWSPEELAGKTGVPVEMIREYEADPAQLTSLTAVRILEGMPLNEIDADLFERDLPSFPASAPRWLLGEMDARVLEWEAALRIDEARFRDALQCLERALRVSSSAERTARLLLSKAAVLSQTSREIHALEALSTAERCLDRRLEQNLWLRLRLEQLHAVCQVERYDDTELWLTEARELAEQVVGRDWERLQVRCIEGWIAAGQGRTDEALCRLRPLRDDLVSAGRLFEATGIALDLAGLLAGQGDEAAVLELARQLEPLLEDKRIPVPARTPLKLFCWAVSRGNFQAERGHKLALEFRKAGGRLTRPYELPL